MVPFLFGEFFFTHSEAMYFVKSHLFILSFMSLALEDITVKILLLGMSGVFLLMFFSTTFKVSQLIFKYFIHVGYDFVYGVRWWLRFIFFCTSLSRSPNTICWRCYFHFILCFWPLCQILIDHRVWVYFWALYSVPLINVSVLMPVPDCFDYHGLVIYFDVRYNDLSYFVLLSQNYYGYVGSSTVPYKFLRCLFYVCEIYHWYFNGDFIESIDSFRVVWTFWWW